MYASIYQLTIAVCLCLYVYTVCEYPLIHIYLSHYLWLSIYMEVSRQVTKT